jgi:hypothetical protein
VIGLGAATPVVPHPKGSRPWRAHAESALPAAAQSTDVERGFLAMGQTRSGKVRRAAGNGARARESGSRTLDAVLRGLACVVLESRSTVVRHRQLPSAPAWAYDGLLLVAGWTLARRVAGSLRYVSSMPSSGGTRRDPGVHPGAGGRRSLGGAVPAPVALQVAHVIKAPGFAGGSLLENLRSRTRISGPHRVGKNCRDSVI